MSGTVQDIATAQNRLDDSSSVMSFRSRGVQMSMATSFAAHVALGFAIMAMMPERSVSLGGPVTEAVVMVDMLPSAPVTKPVVTKLVTKSVDLQNSATKPDLPKLAPSPLVEKAEVVLRSAPAPAEKKSAKAATPSTMLSDLPSRATPVSYAPQTGGTKPAPIAKHGDDAEEEMIITNPRFREPPKPANYPKRARELDQQGEALIRARLDFEGNAEEVVVLKTSGFVLLDNAALAAVRRWHFEPGRRNGSPVVAWVHVPVRFTLN